MRHRMGIAAQTGLGNPDPALLDNKMTGNEEFDKRVNVVRAIADSRYFSLLKCDVSTSESCVVYGIEPAYAHERLLLLCIHKNKGLSSITNGIAWGFYGSNIVSKTKHYKDYKNKSKFVRFVDKCWEILYE